jgi:exopolysaccharide biosynthesis operon protein EpsL
LPTKNEVALKNLNKIHALIPVVALCAGTTAFAQDAQQVGVFQLRAAAGIEHDDNVLRQSTGEISDSIGTLSVGVHADKRIGLQRLRGDIEASTYRYQDQTNLNYSTINYSAAWDWSITPHFHGVLSADRRQYREVSTDSITFVNRIGRRTERAEVLEGIYDVGAAVRLLGGVTHTSSESTEPRSWDASPRVRSARVGVGYETAKGTLLTLRARRGDGEYTDPTPGAAAGDFKENEVELALKWPVTVKTAVEARVAHLRREHDLAPQLDFSGMVGGASVNWEITGKTRLIAGYQHDLLATGLLTGGHVETDRVYLTPVWQVSPQIAVNARYDRSERRWRDVPAGGADIGRNEHVETMGVGLDWEPRRVITVSTSLRSEKLSSSLPASSYKATVFGVAVKAKY